jgi:hypothetical protein
MRRAPATVVTLLLAIALAVPAPSAGAETVETQLATIRAEISSAKASLAGWVSWLQDWGTRIDRAQYALQQARHEAEITRRALLEADLPRASTAFSWGADAELERAQRRLDTIIYSRQARTGEQSLVAWETYITGLKTQREELLAGAVDVPPVGSPVTFGTWAKLFLTSVGAPACGDNVAVVITWEAQESTAAAYNPLATTHLADGATAFNSVGVRNYGSLEQGVQATADTLQLGSDTYGYGAILDALAACAPAAMTAAAINASAWCRGCAGGGYLTGLLPTVQADLASYASRLIGVATQAA